MIRSHLYISALLSLALLPALFSARPAKALTVTRQSIDGKTTDIKPVSNDQCLRNVEINFRVTNDQAAAYLLIMVGNDCDTDRTAAGDDSCRAVPDTGESLNDGDVKDITIRAQDLGLNCGTSDGIVNVFFLGVENADDDKSGTTDSFKFELEVDTVAPDRPTGVSGGEGEHAIPVKWSYSDTDVDKFFVYYEVVDRCPEDSILCSWSSDCSGTGDAGSPEIPEIATCDENCKSASSSSRKLELMDKVGIGERAAVAVIAVDEAGNGSALSNVSCIESVETVGFCELNEGMGGKCESGCSVSRIAGTSENLWPAICFTLLALITFRRIGTRRRPLLSKSVLVALLALACSLEAVYPGSAAAQDGVPLSDDHVAPERDFESPEYFTLELRIGPYTPDVGNDSFSRAFPDDDGPLIGFEMDYIVFRLKEVLMLGVGGRIAFANYSGNALSREAWASSEVERTEEETDFDLIPLSALAVLRIDVLARKLSIPFVFTGKLGYRWAFWSSETGGASDADGISPGFTWGAQIALDLDFFDRRAARLMDEEWGINHSFIFFEVFGSETESDSLPIDGTIWTAGLGLVT